MTTGTPTATATSGRRREAVLSLRRLVWCFLSWSLWASVSGWSAEPVSREYQLKAAFLYNFTKFIEWPPGRTQNKNTPILIGVLGNNPFGDELAKAVEGRFQNGHPFLVTNVTTVGEVKAVHLLFVPRGQEQLLQEHAAALLAAGVLTVGESEAAATCGSAITFATEADKIRFEINLEAMDHGGFKVSSKLLQLAKVVRRKPQEGPS